MSTDFQNPRASARGAVKTPPERIHGWQDSQLSIARFYGGITYQGHTYTIAVAEKGAPLTPPPASSLTAPPTATQPPRRRHRTLRPPPQALLMERANERHLQDQGHQS